MKIKALVLGFALLAGVSAYAQEHECCGENCCGESCCSEGKTSKGPFITGKFHEDWFVGLGAGVSSVSDGYLSKKGATGFALIGDVTVGKWFDPYWGVRLGVHGLNAYNKLEDEHFKYADLRGDVMWNLTNQLFGYNPKRILSVYPYLTAGILLPENQYYKNFTAGAGFNVEVALGKRVSINADVAGLFARQATISVFNRPMGYGILGEATLGLNVKLGKKTSFETKCSAVAPYVKAAKCAQAQAEAAKAAQEQAAAEAAEAAKKAADDLAAAEAKLNNVLDKYSCTVMFKADKWEIINREKAALLEAAEFVKSCPDYKFVITGYADKQTGYAAYNLKLSEKRAAAVKALLLEYGVPAEQIECVGAGAVDYRFFNDYKLSRSASVTVVK